MPAYGGPAVPSPALDFCQIVGAKQRTPGGTAGVAVPLEEEEQATLDQILAQLALHGVTASLEDQARRFLLVYRERESYSPVLSKDERAKLNQVLEPPHVQRPIPSVWPPRSTKRPLNRRRLATAAVLVVLAAIGGVTAAVLNSADRSGPPAGTAQQHPPAQQVQPGTTDLQQLKQNYGPWQQLTPSDQKPQTGQPALLLLENGGYFASQKWTVPTDASGWQQDIAGNVNNVDVKGNFADITDADSNPYIVGIDQPFIVSSNPGTVLRIDPTGNVLSMSLAQATAQRQPLSH
jgi:hypothetical protein